jgi:hypothetical protein
MDGPAVYPTNAPATAPTGPNTTAPDKAPKAASPPRSWANAPVGTSVNDTAAATTSLFMCVPPKRPDAAATTELRLFEGGLWIQTETEPEPRERHDYFLWDLLRIPRAALGMTVTSCAA